MDENAHIDLYVPGDAWEAQTLLCKIASYALLLHEDIQVTWVGVDVNRDAACDPIWMGVTSEAMMQSIAKE